MDLLGNIAEFSSFRMAREVGLCVASLGFELNAELGGFCYEVLV